jgi:uncharacterized membrane protein
MQRYLFSYAGAALAFLALDFAWLMFANKRLYKPVLGSIMLETPRMVPIVLFYAIYLAGIVIFAVSPALRDGNWRTAALLGAALGFVAYATYDLTNHATLTVWQSHITVIDLAWGTFVTACGATAGYLAASWFAK